MDGFVERLLKTLAIVLGGFLLIYVLIATSSEKPTGLSLAFYSFMNQVFFWPLRLVIVGFIGFLLVLVSSNYVRVKTENKRKIEEEERKREDEQRLKAAQEEAMKQKRISEEENALKRRTAEIERQNRLAEKERYMKNRSAKEANEDALRNFL